VVVACGSGTQTRCDAARILLGTVKAITRASRVCAGVPGTGPL
jgi:hypothetical protein